MKARSVLLRSVLLGSLAVALPSGRASAATLRVPDDRPTLTAAIRAAQPGDRIVLGPGRYSPAGGERFPVRLAGKSLRIVAAGAARTVLDAAGASRIFRFEADDSSTVSDLMLTGGFASDGGGAVLVEGEAAPRFARIVFTEDASEARGDAVLVRGGHPRFVACLFESNGPTGPTACVAGGHPEFVHCTFGGNAGPALEMHGAARLHMEASVVAMPGSGGGSALGLRIVAEPDAPGPDLEDNLFTGCEDGVVRVDGEAGLALATALDESRRAYGLRRDAGGVRDAGAGDWRLPEGHPASARVGAFTGADALPEPRDLHPGTRRAADAPALLGPAVPNPSAPSTSIRFLVPEPSLVDLGVYNVVGERVRTLPAGDLPAGEHERTWDGRDDRGEELPPGIYFVRILVGTSMESRRVVLVR